ncbi:MAG: hypothetical protein ABEH88_07295 [Halobacteriales archaeon]
MPGCHHCDATYEDDEGLAAHLASAHEWAGLGRIDRKRIEVLLPEEVPQEEGEPQLDSTADLDALLDQKPTVDAIKNALAEHERLIRQAQQEGEPSHANDLFWDYFEPLATRLDAVVTAEGWPVLADLMETYDPHGDASDPAPTPVIGNAIGRHLIRTRVADGEEALPEEGLAYLFALHDDESGAGWEEAAAYGWGIGHPTQPVADRIQTAAREDVYWISSVLEHAFYADQHAACDCLAEIVTDEDVDDIRFVLSAVSCCDRVDTWPTVPRYWDWEHSVDLSLEWDRDVVARIRNLVAETDRVDDLPDDWSFQDLTV